MITFSTPEAWGLYDPEAERLHGPPSDLEWYYGPVSGELLITTHDRETFEQDTHLTLTDDCPPPWLWQRLLRWLLKNVGLFDVTGNKQIKLRPR